ncbi:MAG: hypothetical protein U1E05_08335 [Patescibacteria group bacterium]|nr:hypothetical protein [Patescibacteria group bacterium]
MSAVRFLSTVMAASLVAGMGSGIHASDGTPALPPFAAVKSTVEQHYAAISEFEQGDLITRDQVEPLLAQLDRLGWNVADGQAILGQTLPPGEFLPGQLRGSKKGLAFMRAVSGMPLAYDRLDRLARLPHGKQTVHDMIHKAGGTELVQYLTTAKGGKELGKMLTHAPRGHDFNKPTGRIYTVSQLLDQLEASYRRASPPRNPTP